MSGIKKDDTVKRSGGKMTGVVLRAGKNQDKRRHDAIIHVRWSNGVEGSYAPSELRVEASAKLLTVCFTVEDPLRYALTSPFSYNDPTSEDTIELSEKDVKYIARVQKMNHKVQAIIKKAVEAR